ncbi:Ral GTPase-activating protein subunit alpha-2 [Clarias magur]|uniref:Ral GTPase-activating protein subunit alpha-2 n=1 Tax=Clarias magur TaxID=1594786 RepID=A0A8J4TRI7_CLAMG|nr:Ral GTPase-activating protein subunit alpha-2 [Clarias magur]
MRRASAVFPGSLDERGPCNSGLIYIPSPIVVYVARRSRGEARVRARGKQALSITVQN